MAKEQSTFYKIWGTIVNPGGDPEAIRRAAQACRKLADDVKATSGRLGPAAAQLKGDWKGKVSDNFQETFAKFQQPLGEYPTHLEDTAGRLEKVADAIHEADIQARNFEIMVGATLAAGVLLTVFTFGTSDAAAVGAIEAEATVMATMLARLSALLAGEAEAMSALISSAELVAARFLMGIGFSTVATVGVTALSGKNVLDPANYNAAEATNILLGGTLGMGFGAISDLSSVKAAFAARPLITGGAFGAVGGASGSIINQAWLGHQSLADPKTWGNVLKTAGLASLFGVAAGGLYKIFPPGASKLQQPPSVLTGSRGGFLFPPGDFPRAGRIFSRPGLGKVVPGPVRRYTTGDWVRSLPGIPTGLGMIAFNGLSKQGPFGAGLYSFDKNGNTVYPQALQPPPRLSSPTFPAAPAPPPVIPLLPAPNLSGTHYTVDPGESLWAIAQHVYGDGSKFGVIAQANHIRDPWIIQPGQRLIIPHLQPPPRVAAGG